MRRKVSLEGRVCLLRMKRGRNLRRSRKGMARVGFIGKEVSKGECRSARGLKPAIILCILILLHRT